MRTIIVPAITEKFVARDKFVTKNGRVKICWLGENFMRYFLDKVEEPSSEATLCYRELPGSKISRQIITNESDFEEKKETTLAEIFSLMEKQKKGENGDLLTDGSANIFYVRDINNALRGIDVYWEHGGWNLRSLSITHKSKWSVDRRIFSCG